MIEILFAELHTPLFLNGTNLGNKLDPSRKDLKLQYDRDNKELLVIYKGAMSVIPTTGNVASMTPQDPSQFGIDMGALPKKEIKLSPIPSKPVKAQVEVPHEKVQNPPTRRSVPGQ